MQTDSHVSSNVTPPNPQPDFLQYPLSSQQAKRHFGGIGLALALFMIVPNIAVSVLGVVIGMLFPAAVVGGFITLFSYALIYLLGFPVFLMVIRNVPDTVPAIARPQAKISPVFLAGILLVCLGVSYALAWVTEMLAILIQAALSSGGFVNPLQAMVESTNPFLNLIIVGIVAPVMEEIIFRSILYKKLIGFGDKTYIFFSAFLFSMIHANIFQIPYAFVLGAIFAGIIVRTGCLRYTVILHAAVNIAGGCIGSFLQNYAGETAVEAYDFIIVALAAAGIILGAVWAFRFRRRFSAAPGGLAVQNKKEMFINAGMLLFIIFIALTTLLVLFMPLFAAKLTEFLHANAPASLASAKTAGAVASHVWAWL